MANYNDAQQLLQQLKPIINQCIENHPLVKRAMKAEKAVVANVKNPVDTTAKTVKVKFLPDIFNENVEPLTFPYNPQMENYLTTGTVSGKVVSVWYYQSISNGIVMQDGEWSLGNSMVSAQPSYLHYVTITGSYSDASRYILSCIIKSNSNTPIKSRSELIQWLVDNDFMSSSGKFMFATGSINKEMVVAVYVSRSIGATVKDDLMTIVYDSIAGYQYGGGLGNTIDAITDVVV